MIDIKVLGTGCPSCIRLEELCKQAVSELGVEASITKITNLYQFPDYGVMLTPALVINGKVLVQGKMPLYATIRGWIKCESQEG